MDSAPRAYWLKVSNACPPISTSAGTSPGVFSATDNRLLFGFSKTPSPSSAADWCKYTIDYGAEVPDFPKLGDTQHFAVIGVNAFTSKGFAIAFRGSDVLAVDKPPAGTKPGEVLVK